VIADDVSELVPAFVHAAVCSVQMIGMGIRVVRFPGEQCGQDVLHACMHNALDQSLRPGGHDAKTFVLERKGSVPSNNRT
jgi:hypothetical protein